MTTHWVYVQSEPHLWTVGFYDSAGKWHTDSDGSKEECAERCAWLNGEQPYGAFVWVSTKKEQPPKTTIVGFYGKDPTSGDGEAVTLRWKNGWFGNGHGMIDPDFWLKMIR